MSARGQAAVEMMAYAGFFLLLFITFGYLFISQQATDLQARQYAAAKAIGAGAASNADLAFLAGDGFYGRFPLQTDILGQPYNLSFSSSGYVYVLWRGLSGDVTFLYPTRSGAFFANGGNVSWQQTIRADGTRVNLTYPAVNTGRITMRNQNGTILIGDVP
jgi:hypothetical protein